MNQTDPKFRRIRYEDIKKGMRFLKSPNGEELVTAASDAILTPNQAYCEVRIAEWALQKIKGLLGKGEDTVFLLIEEEEDV